MGGTGGGRAASPRMVAVGVARIVAACEAGDVGRVDIGAGGVVELRALNRAGLRSAWAIDGAGRVAGDGIIVAVTAGRVDMARPRQATVLRALVRLALNAAGSGSGGAGAREIASPAPVAGRGEVAARAALFDVGGEIAPATDGALFAFAWA